MRTPFTAVMATVLLTLFTSFLGQSQATPALCSVRDFLRQGMAAQSVGNFVEAERAFRAAIQCAPTGAIAHYNLGNVLADQGQIDAAISSYQTAIQLDSTNAQAHYNLGYWLNHQGDADSAIAAYREAARLSPFDADTYYNLSLLLSAQSQSTEADIMLSRAMMLNPNYKNHPGRF